MGIEAQLESPLAEAVRRAGSQSAYARMVGRSQSWVYSALLAGKPIQAEHVRIVEQATGLPAHQQRPDLYPREATQATDANRFEGAR